MNVGTRVVHKRQAWLVGTIVGCPVLGVWTVMFDGAYGPQDFYADDLRATPIQPLRKVLA